ncbi:Gfo/Idh/MocA family protein [Roseobacter litoralis]|uniref:Oxidoreductase n=1 Tax=Roseobacter litoralis (strain ATCC 49566 / DSM 6996 / JCM 21268 / NBRC 15278 / OCh 149) TaxID=391595 RepID=F7ZI88_ROSLO|nr:Gfo/Idh/MocA family oxidoreductase [Roseobacter litoralis]AEI96224.1 oxidoreductase [Roseobacter litoralis Och 149]
MAIESFGASGAAKRLRLGMVGGGQGAFIGAVHRMAARLDDKFMLVAGALSADAERARASGAELGLDPERTYDSWTDMLEKEAARKDGIDVVSIVTPNHLHYDIAKAFLQKGIHVICDKPMTVTLEESLDLVRTADASGAVFVLTQNNTGYPLVRQARKMVADGTLGDLQVIRTSYVQDWLTTALDAEGQKQAAWRTDPAQAGAGGSIGDIGVHAFNLAAFISGLELEEVCADMRSYVPGRQLDDNANVLLRYKGGATGTLWTSQVAPGNYNRLSIGIYGTKGGLEWVGEDNDNLYYTPFGEPTRCITRGGPGAMDVANAATRMPPRHPEGYIEGFGNVYSNAAEVIWATKEARDPDPMATDVPTVRDGAKGLAFIEACVRSAKDGANWQKVAAVD